jgi:hypothetical protein
VAEWQECGKHLLFCIVQQQRCFMALQFLSILCLSSLEVRNVTPEEIIQKKKIILTLYPDSKSCPLVCVFFNFHKTDVLIAIFPNMSIKTLKFCVLLEIHMWFELRAPCLLGRQLPLEPLCQPLLDMFSILVKF